MATGFPSTSILRLSVFSVLKKSSHLGERPAANSFLFSNRWTIVALSRFSTNPRRPQFTVELNPKADSLDRVKHSGLNLVHPDQSTAVCAANIEDDMWKFKEHTHMRSFDKFSIKFCHEDVLLTLIATPQFDLLLFPNQAPSDAREGKQPRFSHLLLASSKGIRDIMKDLLRSMKDHCPTRTATLLRLTTRTLLISVDCAPWCSQEFLEQLNSCTLRLCTCSILPWLLQTITPVPIAAATTSSPPATFVKLPTSWWSEEEEAVGQKFMSFLVQKHQLPHNPDLFLGVHLEED